MIHSLNWVSNLLTDMEGTPLGQNSSIFGTFGERRQAQFLPALEENMRVNMVEYFLQFIMKTEGYMAYLSHL